MKDLTSIKEVNEACVAAGFKMIEFVINNDAIAWANKEFTLLPIEEDENVFVLRRQGIPVVVFQHGERYSIEEVEQALGRRL